LLNAPLQYLTARAVGLLIPVLGLPATVQGTLVAFPNGTTFEVTPLCSGLEFLVQGLAVATLLGELEQAPAARRLRLLGSVIVLALLTNWARVLIIMDLGYATGMRHVLASRDHVLFGTVLFVSVLVAFVWLATRAPLTAYREAARPTGIVQRSTLAGCFVAAVGLAAAPVLVYLASPSHDDTTAAGTPRWPAGRADWRGPITSDDEDWQPVFVGSHSESRVTYADGAGRRVEVLAVGYSMQEQGRELVNEGNSLLGPELTQLTGHIVDSDGQPYYEMVVVDSQGRESVMWSVYDIGGRSFVIPIFSQLWYGLRSLTAQPPSVLFATRAECVPSCAVGGATLRGFLHLMGSELRTSVRGASEASR
jgi:EpsI family protein